MIQNSRTTYIQITWTPKTSFYYGPIRITDTFASDPTPMATFLWQNHSMKEVTGYASVFFLKRALTKAMTTAINTWQEENHWGQFKLCIEVKTIFKKNHFHMKDPEEKKSESMKRVMLINQ